jgi:ABC-type transport system involved in cytochrome c biogenesis permease subunit
MHNLLLILLLSLGVACMSQSAHATMAPISFDSFAKLPILQDGRIKPLDSFARVELLKFSKKDTIDNQPAIAWLASTLFDPGTAPDQKIFLIANANTRHILGLEERKKPLYSFAELSSGLEKTTAMIGDFMAIPPKQQNADQKDLLSIHENALEYTLILRSFSSILPLNINVPTAWRHKAALGSSPVITYTLLQRINPELESAIKAIIKRKGENPETYTKSEQETVMLGWQLQTLAKAAEDDSLLRVIPLSPAQTWASPWELINDGQGTPKTSQFMTQWSYIATAWQNQDGKSWDDAIVRLMNLTRDQNPANYNTAKITIEIIYNHLAPFTASILLFAGAMVLSFLSLSGLNRFIHKGGLTLLIAAILFQSLGLIARVYLMGRPPVGTLYESLLFVGCVAPLLALIIELKFKNRMGLLIGGITGSLIGILALSMAGEGDNMKVLGAVLNTQFWLATHVLCITIGYGWCLVTSVLAHIILIGRATQKLQPSQDKQLLGTLTTLSLFSVLFTTVGTILGGIWADQSWGRFWGWDPKENGALLIVLWLLWLIHGKIAAQISETIWLGGMAFLSVIVATAWIGVNLLGVGLHSYGFIEGVFWGLGAFTLVELITIGALITYLCSKGKTTHAT